MLMGPEDTGDRGGPVRLPPVRRASPRLTLLLAVSVALAACAQASVTPARGAPTTTTAATVAPPPSATAGTASACVATTTPSSRDWNKRTWYEVFVRSFADSDGDG